MSGAVDLDACETRRGQNCHCGTCAVCGYAMHMSIHGPLFGQPPGSKPFGHEFVPIGASTGRAELKASAELFG